MAHGGDSGVLLGGFFVNFLVVESAKGWLNSVFFSHFEIFSKSLVSTPPVVPDRVQPLVFKHLMEVRVSDVVLLVISWHSLVISCCSGVSVGLSNNESPFLNHAFFSSATSHVLLKREEQMPAEQCPQWSKSVLLSHWLKFPVNVSNWVFSQSGEVFERSPFLGHVSWLFS